MEVNNVKTAENVCQRAGAGYEKKAYQSKIALSDPVDEVKLQKDKASEKNSSTAKKVGAAIGAAAGTALSAAIFQHSFKKAGLKGNLVQNIKTFVNSKPGVIDGVMDMVGEEIGVKKNSFEKFTSMIAKSKAGKIGLLAGCTALLAGSCAIRTSKYIGNIQAKKADKKAELENVK